FGVTIKVIKSDNSIEIVPNQCQKFFAKKGIVDQRSVLGNPQQNGRVERKHKHLIKTTCALRLHCVLAATHLIKKISSSVLQWRTPYENLPKKKPSYYNLRVID
ncbi:hypothetical protein V2J09_003477, partial [Rumex salicifolius]